MSALLDLALDLSSPQTSSASHSIPDNSIILQEELQSLGKDSHFSQLWQYIYED